MRCTISSSHTLTALSPGSETIFHRHLRSFRRYADDESQNQNQTAVNAVGELWEPQTLQLRVTPPIVEIDNRACEDATRITLSSANRPGTLVEVVIGMLHFSHFSMLTGCHSSSGIIFGCKASIDIFRQRMVLRRCVYVIQNALGCF